MKVNWFEIPVTDMRRAKSFYASIFNIKMGDELEIGSSKMSFFPFEQEQEGATGSLILQESYIPSHQGSMVYFSVPSIDDAMVRVEPAGGKVLNPKMSIGEHGYVAHFEDSEGNRVALHQSAS